MRRVTASELLLAVEKLNVPLEYFTDPFRLDGEVLFSWRQSGMGRSELREYERMASLWVGAYRSLAAQVGQRGPLMRQALGLTKHARFEDAMDAGERFVAEFELGEVPAQNLAEVMQDRLGILVLMVDAYSGISGAACRLPEFDTVLIARGEVVGRRKFRLGARAVSHPDLESDAARACGGSQRVRWQPRGAVGQQFRRCSADAGGGTRVVRRL